MAVTIHAPVEGFTGTVAGVGFADGVAEVEDPAPSALHYFHRHGYTIDGESADPVPDGKPAESAGKKAWQAYALTLAQDSDVEAEVRKMTKAQLVEFVTDSESAEGGQSAPDDDNGGDLGDAGDAEGGDE